MGLITVHTRSHASEVSGNRTSIVRRFLTFNERRGDAKLSLDDAVFDNSRTGSCAIRGVDTCPARRVKRDRRAKDKFAVPVLQLSASRIFLEFFRILLSNTLQTPHAQLHLTSSYIAFKISVDPTPKIYDSHRKQESCLQTLGSLSPTILLSLLPYPRYRLSK